MAKAELKSSTELSKIKVKPLTPGIKITRVPTPGMCFYHQQIPATFICARCGRAICHNCGVLYGNITFCPQCSPFGPGIRPSYYEPSRVEFSPMLITMFIMGLVGAIMILAGLTVDWWTPAVGTPYFGYWRSYSGFTILASAAGELTIVLVASIIVLIFSIVGPIVRSYSVLVTSSILLIVFGILSFIFPLEVIVRLNMMTGGELGVGSFMCMVGGLSALISGVMGLLASSPVRRQVGLAVSRWSAY